MANTGSSNSSGLYSELQSPATSSFCVSLSKQKIEQGVDVDAEDLSDESDFSLLGSLSSAAPSVASFSSIISNGVSCNVDDPRLPNQPVGGGNDALSAKATADEETLNVSFPSGSNVARLKMLAHSAASRRQKEATAGDTGNDPIGSSESQQVPATPPSVLDSQYIFEPAQALPTLVTTERAPVPSSSFPTGTVGQSLTRPVYTWDWQRRPDETYRDVDSTFGPVLNPSTSSVATFSPSFDFDVNTRAKESDTESNPYPPTLSSKGNPPSDVVMSSPPLSVLESVATIMPKKSTNDLSATGYDKSNEPSAFLNQQKSRRSLFLEESGSEDDLKSQHDGGEDERMLELGDELSRVIDRLIASTKLIGPSQPTGQPVSEKQGSLSLLKQIDSRWSKEDGRCEQDEIVIAPPPHKDEAQEASPYRSIFQPREVPRPVPQRIVTCETESELSSASSSSSDCESVQATCFISDIASPPPSLRNNDPIITHAPAPITYSTKPGRSLASIMEDMQLSTEDRGSQPDEKLHVASGGQRHLDNSGPLQTNRLHARWMLTNTMKELEKEFAAKSTTGATCGGSARSSPLPLTAPVSPAPPLEPVSSQLPSDQREYNICAPASGGQIVISFSGRPTSTDTPGTLPSPLLSQATPRSTPSPIPVVSARDVPRVRIWEGGVTFPGASSGSSSSWGTLTRSPTPGLTGNTATPLFVPSIASTVEQTVEQPSWNLGRTEWASNRGERPPEVSSYTPAGTNLTGIQHPLPTPYWNSTISPWLWNHVGPSQDPLCTPAGPNHCAAPPPSRAPWAHNGPPPAPAVHAPGTQVPKTPWKSPFPSLPGTIPSMFTGYPPHHQWPSTSGYQAPPPPAPLLGTSSLPWATSSGPQRPVNLPHATPGMGFNLGYPWQTPGPIPGFSPPSGPAFQPSGPAGWTPRTANQATGYTIPFTSGTNLWRWDAPGASQPPSASSRFSFSDATVCFSVQGKEYHVHRHFFEKHSPFFERLLSGFPLHSEWPIPLNQVTQVAFERLLSIFYPLDLANPNELATAEEWTSILELSTFWDFKQLRTRSIKELTTITSPIDRIVLAQTYDVPEWTLSGYRELVVRRRPVTTEEAERLGTQAILKVWQVQSELHSRSHLCTGPCCLPLVDGHVKAEFGLA